MALDFSSLQAVPAHSGQLDFSAIGGVPAVGQVEPEETTALGAAGRGAVGMLPLGDQAYAAIAGLAEKKPYLQEREELKKEIEADKLGHAGSRLAGQAAGLVAPAVLTGGISAPESLAGAVGQGALVGAGYGAGNAIDTAAQGGSGADIAKDIGTGAALGGAGGAAGHAASDILSKFFATAPTLEQEAIEGGIVHPKPLNVSPAPEAAEPTASMINGVGKPMPAGAPTGALSMAGDVPEPSAGMKISRPEITPPGVNPADLNPPSENELRARMLVQTLGGTARQVRKLPGKDMIQTLNHMGDVLEENGAISPLDRMSERTNKVQALHDRAGKIIGETVDSADVPPTPIQPMIDDLATARKFPTPLQAQQLQATADQIKRYAGPDGTLSFQRLHQLKVDIGKEAFAGQGDPILQAAYHVVGNTQDQLLEKVATQVNKPQFDKAKAIYQTTERALPMLRMATAKSLVNKPGLTELLSGHPLAAATSLVKEPLTRAANAIGFKTAGILGNEGANVMSKAGGQFAGVNINHPAMAPYRAAFQQAAAKATSPGEIEKANAVTDFTLSQRDPAYAAAKQKTLDESVDTSTANSTLGLAEGGVVPDEDKITEPIPALGSTLEGFANLLKQRKQTTPSPVQQPIAVSSTGPTFNNDLADKLKAFLAAKENEDAESR